MIYLCSIKNTFSSSWNSRRTPAPLNARRIDLTLTHSHISLGYFLNVKQPAALFIESQTWLSLGSFRSDWILPLHSHLHNGGLLNIDYLRPHICRALSPEIHRRNMKSSGGFPPYSALSLWWKRLIISSWQFPANILPWIFLSHLFHIGYTLDSSSFTSLLLKAGRSFSMSFGNLWWLSILTASLGISVFCTKFNGTMEKPVESSRFG